MYIYCFCGHIFFKFGQNDFVNILVSLCDLVHDMETVHDLY